MKLRSIATLLALATATAATTFTAFAADGGHLGHDNDARHGGVVVEVKHQHYELVVKPASAQLHLRDHGDPVDLSKASAKLTLLTGTQKQEAELKPVGDHLEAAGPFTVGAGTKAVVALTRPAKPVTSARFVLKE